MADSATRADPTGANPTGGGIRSIAYGAPPTRSAAAAFLDRDGVLNVDHGYVHKTENFEWVAGAQAAVARLNALGYRVIVATNQSGIARGYYAETAFRKLSDWMVAELGRAGARLDAVYYCPHHPTEGQGAWRVSCTCRKPAPGMLLAAIAARHIDAAHSVFIGDQDSDMAAAAAAGLRGVKFPGGNLDEFLRGVVAAPPA